VAATLTPLIMSIRNQYGIPEDVCNELKKILRLKEFRISDCTWGECMGVFGSLAGQYKFSSVFRQNSEEYKKCREAIDSCIFGIIMAIGHKTDVFIGIPKEDRGTDTYLRETDRENKTITTYHIQNTIFDSEKPQSKPLASAILEKCKKYGVPEEKEWILLVHLFNTSGIAIEELLNNLNGTETPFKQIILFGNTSVKDCISLIIISAGCPDNPPALRFNYRTLSIEGKGYPFSKKR
jgi:hypothetical protein